VNWSRGVHVLAKLIDGVGDVRTSECDVLESTDDVAIFCGIGENFTGKLGHFGTRNARCTVWLGVRHSSMEEEVLYVFWLPEMEASGVLNYLNAKEVGEGVEILHGEVTLEFDDEGLHGGCIVTCDNYIIDVD